jgi:peroxiredoxin
VQLEADLAQFHGRETEVIAVAVQDQVGAQTAVSETGASYPVLTDADHQIADLYQVYNLLGDGVATPSIFIINKAGQIVWSYIGQDVNDRPNNETILSKIPTT